MYVLLSVLFCLVLFVQACTLYLVWLTDRRRALDTGADRKAIRHLASELDRHEARLDLQASIGATLRRAMAKGFKRSSLQAARLYKLERVAAGNGAHLNTLQTAVTKRIREHHVALHRLTDIAEVQQTGLEACAAALNVQYGGKGGKGERSGVRRRPN